MDTRIGVTVAVEEVVVEEEEEEKGDNESASSSSSWACTIAYSTNNASGGCSVAGFTDWATGHTEKYSLRLDNMVQIISK